MRRIVIMIVLAIATLWVAGTRSKAAAQAVVHDPAHMSSNAVGFVEELRSSMEQTMNLLNLLNLSEKQLEQAKKAIDHFEKVSMSVRTLENVYNTTYILHNTSMTITQSIKDLKRAVSSGHVTHQEAVKILSCYTNFIKSITSIADALAAVTTQGCEAMTSFERMKEVDEASLKTAKFLDSVNKFNKVLKTRLNFRETLKANKDYYNDPDFVEKYPGHREDLARKNKLSWNQMMSPVAAEIAATGPNSVTAPGDDEIIYIPTSVIMAEIDDFFTKAAIEAEKIYSNKNTTKRATWAPPIKSNPRNANPENIKGEYTKTFNGLGTIFYAISALVGLLGAAQVYRKYQIGGEDLTKSIAIWSCGTLLIFMLGFVFGF